MRHLEHKLQVACVRWFSYEYPTLRMLLFAVPNGAYLGKSNARRGKQLKNEGMVSGVSDLILLMPNDEHHGLCIEMKLPKGKQSESQFHFQANVQTNGYRYEIVRSFNQFEKLIKEYLNG